MSFLFPKDNSARDAAEQARAEEAARQSRIVAGTERVNKVFGQFDDDYYKKVADTALAYYSPEVNRQYADAKKKLTFSLARSGNLASTAGAGQLRELNEAKARADVDVANRAQGYGTDLRRTVEGQRDSVLSNLHATADPDAAMSSATSAAELARAAPSYAPLYDLFSSFVTAGGNAIAAERAGYRGAGTGLFSTRGSSKVIST